MGNNQAKYTPGPWTAKDGQIYSEADPKSRTLALIPYYDHEPEQDANAQLIAAAPEMAGILRGILDRVAFGDMGPIHDKAYWLLGGGDPLIKQAMAIMAKVEGQP